MTTALLGSIQVWGAIFITEVMYNPPSKHQGDEFIEIYNASEIPQSLAGAKFVKGVDFAFPEMTLAPYGYLVIAANLDRFKSLHPTVDNAVGGWIGQLSNTGETVEMEDAMGRTLCSVAYADEGDWAERYLGPVDLWHRGLEWRAKHDGSGSSLELINYSLSQEHAHNWSASVSTNGTPGRANSVSEFLLAPLISAVNHSPPIPNPREEVAITAIVEDFSTPKVTLHYRIDRTTEWISLPMWDDGFHQDGGSEDGRFGVKIPPQANHAVVEFYVRAQGDSGLVRTWPSPVEVDGARVQRANALFQVDDTIQAKSQPLYKLIFTEADRKELENMGSNWPDTGSNAQLNGTFISADAEGTMVRYLTGVRNRGNGSRGLKPNNYRVNFRSDDRWHDTLALNLNGQKSYVQVLGSMLSLGAQLLAPFARAVQVRVNNMDLTENVALNRTYGSYAAVQVVDSDWAENFFPDDAGGNIYQARRILRPGANLRYQADISDPYRVNYFKNTNESEDDWTDLIELTRILNRPVYPDYVSEIKKVINLEAWLRYFAVSSFYDNNETALSNGDGDDYLLYRGEKDTRFVVIPWDLDTIFGEAGSGAPGSPKASLFRATSIETVNKLLKHPDIVPRYFQILRELCGGVFSQEELQPAVEHYIGRYVPVDIIQNILKFAEARRTYIREYIPSDLTLNCNLPETNGIFFSTNAVIEVFGKADPVVTRKILVNGTVSEWIAWQASWTNRTVVMNPGVNMVVARAFDTNNMEVAYAEITIFYASDPDETTGVVTQSVPPIGEVVPIGDSPTFTNIVINEILAENHQTYNHEANWPDIIELYNPTSGSIYLGGYGLSDDASRPYKFMFHDEMLLPPGGYLVLFGQKNGLPGALQLGFGLDANGDELLLSAPILQGGRVLDAIKFGPQIPDFSIGRFGNSWALAHPTPADRNITAARGSERKVKINEWLAEGPRNDFIELYNPESLPVEISGMSLSDVPITLPAKHSLHPLSFIASKGHVVFVADGEPEDGPNHLNFKLSPHFGMIGLSDSSGILLDLVVFGPQQFGFSEGRGADGSLQIGFFSGPTPDAPNPGGTGDSDSDGMSDEWELKYFLDPQSSHDAFSDFDRDGASNMDEWLSGSNPRDPLSQLRLTASKTQENLFNLSFPAAQGRSYAVEFAPFSLAEWQIVTNISNVAENGIKAIVLAPNEVAGFYRLKLIAGE